MINDPDRDLDGDVRDGRITGRNMTWMLLILGMLHLVGCML